MRRGFSISCRNSQLEPVRGSKDRAFFASAIETELASIFLSVISVLQDRNYVRIDKRRFIPEDRGRLVTTFLSSFFERYVEYDFTADLEEKLDHVSGGQLAWKQVLVDFWVDFKAKVDDTKDLSVRNVLDVLNEELRPHFFPERADGSDARSCPKCNVYQLSSQSSLMS